MMLDMRYTENDSVSGIIAAVQGCCGKDIAVETVTFSPPLDTTTDNIYVKKLKAAAESVLQRAVNFSAEYGSTDARYFAAKNIPVAIMWCLGENEHASDEYVEIGSLDKFYGIMKKFILSCSP